MFIQATQYHEQPARRKSIALGLSAIRYIEHLPEINGSTVYFTQGSPLVTVEPPGQLIPNSMWATDITGSTMVLPVMGEAPAPEGDASATKKSKTKADAATETGTAT